MSAFVEHADFLGKPAVRLVSDALEAWLVPELGGNLLCLRTRGDRVDILRTPASWEQYLANPNLFGIPVLCPPNRIADGVFRYQNHTYHLTVNEPRHGNHIHGFANDKPWRLLHAELVDGVARAQIEWRAADFPDVLAQYPHALVLRLSYELQGSALVQQVEVQNQGETTAPFGIGFHTTFGMPFRPAVDPTNYRLAITVDRRWELDERMLPTGQLQTLSERAQWRTGKPVAGLVLDDAFTAVADPGQMQKAVLVDDASGITVTYTCADPICQWVLYTRDGHSGFISIEPYTWVTNAPNLNLPKEVTGMRDIAPGEVLTLRSVISVQKD